MFASPMAYCFDDAVASPVTLKTRRLFISWAMSFRIGTRQAFYPSVFSPCSCGNRCILAASTLTFAISNHR